MTQPPAERLTADDIERLKADHIVGEGRDGRLHLLGRHKDSAPAAHVNRLVNEENHDRTVIMQHVVNANSNLAPADIDLVSRIMYRLNVQIARVGDYIQQTDGRWTAVKKTTDSGAAGARRER